MAIFFSCKIKKGSVDLILHFLTFLASNIRGVVNGKAGKAATLPKFLDMLTLSQSGGGADYTHPLAIDMKTIARCVEDFFDGIRKYIIDSVP